MMIKGAAVLCEDGQIRTHNIAVENERIVQLTTENTTEEAVDASDWIALPGFVDTHIHGFCGTEFASTTEDFASARLGLAKLGTTTVAPTVRAMPIAETAAIEKHIVAQSKQACVGAMLGGIHLEGPFISAVRSGAMVAPDEICSPEAMNRLIAAGDGFLKIMTLAPERENAVEAVQIATKSGVQISIGHTDATFAQANAAIAAGASRMTHTFNAVRPFQHRETGALGACLTDERVCCEMISDFVHLAPETVKIIYRLKGAEHIAMVSDAGMMTGLPDGTYTVGGHVRTVQGNTCRNQAGRLAGSTCTLVDGVRNLWQMGLPLADISRMASLNPAKALGLAHQIGTIAVGKRADIVCFDRAMHLRAVFVGGHSVL